jgi:hypothetical protein
MRARFKRHLGIAFLSLLGLSAILGCAKPSAYKAPVATFRDASVLVIQTTQTYLTQLNKVERDNYIYQHASAIQQIKLDEIQKQQVFSTDGINARLSALDQLSQYTSLLYQLSTSDAPDNLTTEATNLQTAVTGLETQINGLTGGDDSRFKSAAAGAFPILGEILSQIAQHKLEAALKDAIAKGAEPVNTLISAIESDATIAYERKRTAESAARVIAIDQYNREFVGGKNPDKLKAYADAISAEEDRWEAFGTAQPTAGLESMKAANTALVTFARTPRPNIHDIGSLADAMSSFASTALRLSTAVQALLNKNQGGM